jgi:hypothetical protein
MRNGRNIQQVTKKTGKKGEREKRTVPESHGNSKPDKSMWETFPQAQRSGGAAPLPKEKGSAADEEETRNAARDKRQQMGKLGRTKEKAGRVGYLSSLRRPVAREKTHRSQTAIKCWQRPAAFETQKGQEEPAACLNGLPVFVQTPIRSNIQFCGHLYFVSFVLFFSTAFRESRLVIALTSRRYRFSIVCRVLRI